MISIFNERKRTFGKGEEKDIYITVNVDFRKHLFKLKGARLGVFMCIALHADENGWAFPSIATIMRETGYKRWAVFQALKELEEATIDGHRFLLRYQAHGQDGTFKSNKYLIFPSENDIAFYLPCASFHDSVKPRVGETATLSRTIEDEEEPLFV